MASTIDNTKASIKNLLKVDANKDGWITKEELFEAIGNLGPNKFEALFKAVEKNDRGEVSCDGLVEWLFEGLDGDKRDDEGAPEKPPDASASELNEARRPLWAQAHAALGEEDAANLKPHHLSSWQSASTGLVLERRVNKVTNPMAQEWPAMNFLNPDELVAGHIILNDSKAQTRPGPTKNGCVRANACKDIWWKPEEVKAAIVTCGGLCPGLNSIIREVTNCLWYQYGVRDVFGMQGGYVGLSEPQADFAPVQLTPKAVQEIHMKGGSILKAGRGGFDADKICENLEEMGINMLFTVGGDGTQSASHQLYEAAKKRNLKLSIIGVPKSIDNDVLLFDKTFGFETAVAQASEVVRNAWVEATSCHNGVGIVRLMGRDAGWIAMHAALSSTIVDLVLVPEVPFKMEDVKAHVDATVARKHHMVILVAEGAGDEHVSTGQQDATGHTIYGDMGIYLRDTLNKHLKAKGGRTFYIDPSYVIRSCPIRPNDHIFCSRLARDAVHTAMRGYTGVCIGPLHNIIVVIPSKFIAAGKKKMKLTSSFWQSCVQTCNMPRNLSGLEQDL